MSGRFEDAVVWITGAGSGIGRALSLEMAREGASVAVSDLRVDAAEETVRRIAGAGGRAVAIGCDVTDEAAVSSTVDRIVSELGKLDVAVACAGMGLVGGVEDLTAAQWRHQMEVNVVGVATTCRLALPHLRATRGRLVLIGSVFAYITGPTAVAYAASKYAIRALGQTLAMELHGTGVSCTVIHPAFVDSNLMRFDNDGYFHPGRTDPRPKALMWSADRAARRFARVIHRRERTYIMSWYGKLGVLVGHHWPDLLHFAGSRLGLTKTKEYGRRTTADEVVTDLDLEAKVALVTGATAGIGFETARAIASAGARTFIGCRTVAKGEATKARILKAHPNARVELLEVELGSAASVRRACASFPAERLDILICNAGVYGGKYEETEEGIERTVGVCHFGHAQLVNQLLPRMLDAAPSRVVMVASDSHRTPARLNFDKFPQTRGRYFDFVAYGQAKLCNVLFANELDRRYRERGLTVSSLHPGSLLPTSIDRRSIAAKVALLVARPFSKSLSQGAATTVFCATRPELEGEGGRYYVDCAQIEASAEARDPNVARRLWDLTTTRLALDWV